MKQNPVFKTKSKILYLLPTPSMKGGMTATTQMFYDIGFFDTENIYHFDTMFTWGKSSFVRFFESIKLKLFFIVALIKYKPDAIFVIMSPYWGFYDKISYCLIAKIFGIKTVFNSVSGRFTPFYEGSSIQRILINKLITIPDVVVLGSPFWMKYFNARFKNIRTYEIGNPVITSNFIPKKTENETIRVISAFRITKEKGIQELVAVIKKVCANSNDFVFCILGEGPALPWLKSELEELIQKGKVEVMGFITGEKKNNLISSSDAYIMLSHFDMVPIALLEAMAASLPIFSTHTGGIPDLITEGENGHLFEIWETEAVAEKLLSYANQRNLLKEMGKNGFFKVKKEYDIEVIINKQLDLIDSLVGNKVDLVGKIYNLMPTFIQNIGISIYGYQWKKRRLGGIFKEELVKFKSRESFTINQWEEYQTTELRKLLIHSNKNVPYYNVLFQREGLSEAILSNFKLSDLKKIPFLEKSSIRKESRGRLLSLTRESGGQFYSSSGSTGTPTEILFSSKMHQKWSAAFEARIRNWAGLSIQNARGMIGGRRIITSGNAKGPFYRYNRAENQVYLSAYHISPNHVSNYVEGIKKYKVDYMTGYAMSNYFLARFIKEQHIEVPQLKAVICSSEKLTTEMRKTFQDVYGCKTYDSYSGVEACGLVSECEHGKLHISPDVGITELIKEDGTYAKPGETGEAICTGLLNYDQPLIRYRIGDLLKLSANQTCTCGRNMPIIDEIIGRIEDTVIGKDGREMVRFHGVFINMPKIIEGQIIQHSLTDFEIVVVTTSTLEYSEKQELKKRMESQLGSIQLKVTETDSIPRNQNGKFKAVISYVNKTK